MVKQLFLLVFVPYIVCAEPADTVFRSATDYRRSDVALQFSPKQLLVPGALVALGTYCAIDKRWNEAIKKQVVTWPGDTKVDDALIFLPLVAAYSLDWCGIRSQHALPDKTVIMATAAVFTLGTTFALKETACVARPDGSDNRSFPSRHTAIAFAGAELLRQEYGERSVWYGIAGYGVAAGSGFLRMYNNRHWFSDVVAGAGIGILSTRAAYWLYPAVRKLYAKENGSEISFLPYVSTSGFGLACTARF